jgi:hypothetical protein
MQRKTEVEWEKGTTQQLSAGEEKLFKEDVTFV